MEYFFVEIDLQNNFSHSLQGQEIWYSNISSIWLLQKMYNNIFEKSFIESKIVKIWNQCQYIMINQRLRTLKWKLSTIIMVYESGGGFGDNKCGFSLLSSIEMYLKD